VGSVQKSSTSPVRVTQRGYRLIIEVTVAGRTTGRVPMSRTLRGTAVNQAPVGGTAAKVVRCSTTCTPAAGTWECAERSRLVARLLYGPVGLHNLLHGLHTLQACNAHGANVHVRFCRKPAPGVLLDLGQLLNALWVLSSPISTNDSTASAARLISTSMASRAAAGMLLSR
jgi:hypothetical protein